MLPTDSSTQWIVLAQILRPQGRRGEVLADLFTDFPERFTQHPQVWLAAAGFADAASPSIDPKALPQPATIAAHWLPVGRNAGRIVLHFANVDTIELAERLAGKEVIVPRTERLELEADATYVSDLAGCTVFDHGHPIGVVDSVQFPSSPDGTRRLEEAASLLAVLSREGDEILIPYAKAYLRAVDLAAKSIHMDLPEGLVEINLPNQAGSPKAEASHG